MDRTSQHSHGKASSLTSYQRHNKRKGKVRGKRTRNPLAFPDATPTRRISTAAGQRLEEILETDISGTKKQGNLSTRNESPSKFLSTSKYLSLLGEESDKVEPQDGDKTVIHCLPAKISIRRSTDDTYCEKAGAEGVGFGQKYNLLRQKRRRLAIIILLVFVLATALAVGLALGLSNNNKGLQSPPPQITKQADSPDNNEPTTSAAFPLGTHSVVTFLDTVQTDCTSEPSAWTCYPYRTFAESPTGSLTVFNWIIKQDPGSNLTISSTSNPFALVVPPTSLLLVDEGSDDERYQFDIIIDKQTAPPVTIGDDGAMARCMFNDTSLQASLFTRKARTYPAESQGVDSDTAFPLWPFAAEVEQAVGSSSNVPICHKIENGTLGEVITRGSRLVKTAQQCSCKYRNYGSS